MNKYLRSVLILGVLFVALTGTASALSEMKDVRVKDGGETTQYFTTKNTVGEFLESENIELSKNDRVSLPADEQIIPNYVTTIEIIRAIDVSIKIDDAKTSVNMPAGAQVGHIIDLLEKRNNETYSYNGNRKDVVEDGETVTLKTVKDHSFEKVELIPFETEFVLDDAMFSDEVELIQVGEPGERVIVTNVSFVAGESSDANVTETITKEPVNRIVRQGTKQRPAVSEPVFNTAAVKMPEAGVPITMNASAYTNGEACTGKSEGDPGFGVTASGMEARVGVVAVDPKFIPLGTKLYIEGYGNAIAGDTGGSIVGNKIDLFFDTYDECLQFGRRDVVVYVLAE